MLKKLILFLFLFTALSFAKGTTNNSVKEWDYFKPKIKNEISTSIAKRVQAEMKSNKKKKDKAKHFRVTKRLWNDESKRLLNYITRNLPKGVSSNKFQKMLKKHEDWILSSSNFYKSYQQDTGNKNKVKAAKFRADQAKSKFDFYLRFLKNNMKKKKSLKKVKKVKKHKEAR